MKIIINNSSMVPIYEQIMEQIKAQIISGELKEDDASKHSQGKKESSDDGKSNVGCGSVLLCFLFMFCMMWFAMMVDSLCK